MNHSCEPNCGFLGNVILVTIRDIAAGEELTFDYAMSDGCDYDEFECRCGQPSCRGKVTGNDWMVPDAPAALPRLVLALPGRRIARLAPVRASKRAFAAV